MKATLIYGAGDSEAFQELTGPYRRELQVHCYRILGSAADGEHGLRGALTPILTIFGLDVGLLLGGAVLTEKTFSLNGLGKYGYDAAQVGDRVTLPVQTGRRGIQRMMPDRRLTVAWRMTTTSRKPPGTTCWTEEWCVRWSSAPPMTTAATACSRPR